MTLLGVLDRPMKVAVEGDATKRNWYWDADTTLRNTTSSLERFGSFVSVGPLRTLTSEAVPLDPNSRDATLRLKITEPGETLNADTNLNSLTPWLLSARCTHACQPCSANNCT